jgi:transcriptional regulator with XRE-family HTH domain
MAGRAARAAEVRQTDTAANHDFVGKAVRDLRIAKNRTLADLARASGLSVGHLSQIERGVSSPSVKSLHAISRALDVTISWFFLPADPVSAYERDYIVRHRHRRALSFNGGVKDSLLSPNLSRGLELILCELPPGAESGSEPYTHRGEETGLVLEGTLEIWVGERHFVLEAGDSFAFSSEEAHRSRNPGSSTTRVVWAIAPPTY